MTVVGGLNDAAGAVSGVHRAWQHSSQPYFTVWLFLATCSDKSKVDIILTTVTHL